MPLTTTFVYRYVTDNSGSICTDNNDNLIYIDYIIVTSPGVEIKRVRNKTYPCVKCIYYGSYKKPATLIHAIQQQNTQWLPNIGASCKQPFAEMLGTCYDFVERT